MRDRGARVAAVLWIAWAVIAWNVVLDQSIVLAGRRYIVAAVGAAQGPGPYARMDDWMQPAVTRGLWTATIAAGAIVVVGFVLLRLAMRPPDASDSAAYGQAAVKQP